ncbi:exopolysaccharide biosynthesis polyprenyl glycosylphosphotransferase [Flavobacterium sp. NG2]|uniref:exopolysaccharide biosynthesis polyprenyl glycosylphosphotransferase n=1 Tax=Flavobacterium sp. NG2 TaxID=3097547 RepID=UPI002A809BBA|nr:exopolysaccharide biosynthesis polyprenyl glycosylphosphotransferase [Flavobacterium sp. NG2]WPR72272.1 exopolysaccharide biosynthesis polyprenyl glycosylphosphotransferase [Flavobacterium sp. NG2]
MKTKTGRYSGYIRPFSCLLDLITINVLSAYISGIPIFENFYAFFMTLSWFVIALQLGFYEVYRYTKVISILNCALKQAFLFTVSCLALAFYYTQDLSFNRVLFFSISSITLILIFKLFIYFFLRKFRLLFKGNFRRVLLIGRQKNIEPLQHFFEDNPDYGYELVKIFNLDSNKSEKLKEFFLFVNDNRIDEIYCSLVDLTTKEINEFIYFADNNLKTLKFIPDEKRLLSLNANFEYYDTIPVIPQRVISLDDPINKIGKRIFDIVFSLFIIVGIMSWLIPIIAFWIKMESKGPIFFKQIRKGLNNEEFVCYKFRSMKINKTADINQVSKNDPRITKVGKFIRKTSIDELPQFFNVLLGDMSVVGPRPHMVSHSNMYAERIDKFMVRHFIVPGITGLAQTKGYRGEVEKDEDIINRVKFDIYYIENWSLFLDLKIIFQTVVNIISGDEKAY